MKIVRLLILMAFVVALTIGAGAASKPKPDTLQIQFIDVEGGQATLIVTPAGQSMLVDTGYPGFEGRDAGRIVDAIHRAGLDHLDFVLITHYHDDHVGGVPPLLAKGIKVGTFLDHGENQEDNAGAKKNYAAYLKAIGDSKHLVLRPGDAIPLKGLRVRAVVAAGEHLAKPLAGAGKPNPNCAAEPAAASDPTENARSLGFILEFGKFRFADFGDLTKQKEIALVCPNNLVGTVDVYLTTHHGLDQSNAAAIVDALHPRVAIMNNGPHKGGKPAAWQTVHDSPGLEDLWQIHYAADADAAHNVDEKLIANPQEKCSGQYLEVDAKSDGSFTVSNSRNEFMKTYAKK